MGLHHIAPLIEADNRRIVMEDTWGHLAPTKNIKYRGRVVYAIGVFDSGELNPTVIVSDWDKGLQSSPWFYQALHDFLGRVAWQDDSPSKQRRPAAQRFNTEGCVYEWTGTFKNYVFEGQVRLLFDANPPKTCQTPSKFASQDLRAPANRY